MENAPTRYEQLAQRVNAVFATASLVAASKQAQGQRQGQGPTLPHAPKKPTAASIRAEARAADKARWREYEGRVRELTEQLPLHLVPGIELRGQEYHLDHKLAVKTCFRAGLPPEKCATIDNLQILDRWENFRKGTACYSSIESRRLPMAA